MASAGDPRVLIDVSDPRVGRLLTDAIQALRPELRAQAITDGIPSVPPGGVALVILEDRTGRTAHQRIRSLRKQGNRVPVIVTSSRAKLRFGTSALGPVHHLRKPFGLEDLRRTLEAALQGVCLRCVAIPHASQPSAPPLVGKSPQVLALMDELRSVASSNATVLLLGRTGSGKEYFAKMIHRHSRRSKGRFVTIDCGTLSPSLTESELFGHAKGAFTGADSDREGLIEKAHGGTLFLDEIGDLPVDLQAKLLRLLQEKEYRRVGTSDYRKADVRILAATHADLEALVLKGRFREDLLYRLNGSILRIPSLSERIEDLPVLFAAFLEEFARIEGRETPRFTPSAQQALVGYAWPGNVRELRNLAERLVSGRMIEVIDLADVSRGLRSPLLTWKPAAPDKPRPPERESVLQALRECGGVVAQAALKLGISRQQLYRLMQKYRLSSEV